jgi:hypothetical protein
VNLPPSTQSPERALPFVPHPSPYSILTSAPQDIIQPLSNLDPNPFRDSPDSLAILDALVPGGYLHNALMDLSKAGDFTVLDLMLEMRLGGARSSPGSSHISIQN